MIASGGTMGSVMAGTYPAGLAARWSNVPTGRVRAYSGHDGRKVGFSGWAPWRMIAVAAQVELAADHFSTRCQAGLPLAAGARPGVLGSVGRSARALRSSRGRQSVPLMRGVWNVVTQKGLAPRSGQDELEVPIVGPVPSGRRRPCKDRSPSAVRPALLQAPPAPADESPMVAKLLTSRPAPSPGHGRRASAACCPTRPHAARRWSRR